MGHRIDYENHIFILYLFNRLKLNGGRMRTAKLLYLLENDLFNTQMIGPTYVMKRYQMGPYNPQIATDLRNLGDNSLLDVEPVYFDKIDEEVDVYIFNRNTTKFLKSIEELLDDFSPIFEKLDTIVDIYAKKNADELKNLIYSLKNTGKKKTNIYSYRDREVIIDPREITRPKFHFQLDEDWYDTVEILLNPDLYHGLQNSIEDARKGRFTHELS